MKHSIILAVAGLIALALAAGCTAPVNTSGYGTPAVPATTLPASPPVTMTPAPTPVITRPAPLSTASDLLGTWYLQEILLRDADVPLVPQEAQAVVTFGRGGQMTGNTGCNNYEAPYTVTGRQLPSGTGLSIGKITASRMLCIGMSDTEDLYLGILANAVSYQAFPGGFLILTDSYGNALSYGATPFTTPASGIPSF